MKYILQESETPEWWVFSAARIMCEIGDWIGRHHYDKVF